MSWSVSACGPAAKAAEQLEQQFTKINMNDKGEQEIVNNVRLLVSQTLAITNPDKIVNVSASGSMGYADWGTKEKPYQSVDLKIAPIHFSV
jgi:hypothetical protein